MTNNKMKAIVATRYGSPDVLQLKKMDKPRPGPHEVLVKVVTSSATKADTMMRTGKPWFGRLIIGWRKPKHPIPGTGFAGIIESTGAEVSHFEKGDRVFGETTLGFSANAEYLTIAEDGVILHKPESLRFIEAASFCDGHLTSYVFLVKLARVQSGQKVLINGASGALGTAAVQIAKNLGAHVTAVCSGKNAGLVRSLGADEVIDYQKQDFTQSQNRYEVIYDAVGKSSFRRTRKVLTKNGLYLSPVLQLSLLVQMIITTVISRKKAKFQAVGMYADEKLRSYLSEVLKIHQKGKLKTVIDRQFPLEKLADAHRYIDTGRKKGNIVIVNTMHES